MLFIDYFKIYKNKNTINYYSYILILEIIKRKAKNFRKFKY